MPYQFAIRLDDDLLDRIDALVPKLSTPWHEATRTDVIRACLLEGLPKIEQMASKLSVTGAHPTAPPRKPR